MRTEKILFPCGACVSSILKKLKIEKFQIFAQFNLYGCRKMNLHVLIAFLLTLEICVNALNTTATDVQWRSYKLKFNRTYNNFSEEAERFKIFKKNVDEIEEHNRKYERGETTFKMIVNREADRTLEEIEARYKVEPG